MHTVIPKTLRFGSFTLDLQSCSLLCGPDGIQLRPKSFDVLRYLAEHSGRVISKDELIEALWPNRAVTDDSVVQCITEIRAVLRDEAHQIIKTVPRRGYLFAADLSNQGDQMRSQPLGLLDQKVTFCRTRGGVNLAVACVGEGTPVVIVPTWLTHLEHDWESPTRAQLLRFLSNRFQIIRYDGRGFGLSDRNVQQISFETLEQDLETVVDALGLRSYALLGISQGAATAISHAARHTDRVAKLVLHGGFALGRDKRTDSSHAEMGRALGALLRQGLDKQESAYLRIFNSVWYPGASNEQIRWYADLLRTSASEETYLKNRSAAADIDVRNLLPRVQAPTLVLHCRYDNAVPFDEGRRIATSIPNAKLVSLNSENHVPLSGEAAMNDFLREIGAFLSD